jgi:hypothetical protein
MASSFTVSSKALGGTRSRNICSKALSRKFLSAVQGICVKF